MLVLLLVPLIMLVLSVGVDVGSCDVAAVVGVGVGVGGGFVAGSVWFCVGVACICSLGGNCNGRGGGVSWVVVFGYA